MAYNRINWENAPSTATPLDADNLNRMDAKIADLDTSMDAVQEGYTEMSNEMDLVNARIDTFTNLPDGSTTGDAELADARIGADGVTYNTLGQAVRTQFTNLNNKTTTDTAPTYGSTKPVQSGGTYTAIQDVIAKFAPAFSESATYSIGDYCTYDDKIYRAKAAITSGNDFVSGYWTELSSISVIIKEMRNIVTDTEVVIGSSYPAGTFLVYDGVLYEAISDSAPFNPSGGAGSAGWRGVRLDDIIARTNANFADQYTRKTYSAGDYCVQMGVLYRANTDISTAEAFTANHWDQVSVTEVLGGLDVAVTNLKADISELNLKPIKNLVPEMLAKTTNNVVAGNTVTLTDSTTRACCIVPVEGEKIYSINTSESNNFSGFADAQNKWIGAINTYKYNELNYVFQAPENATKLYLCNTGWTVTQGVVVLNRDTPITVADGYTKTNYPFNTVVRIEAEKPIEPYDGDRYKATGENVTYGGALPTFGGNTSASDPLTVSIGRIYYKNQKNTGALYLSSDSLKNLSFSIAEQQALYFDFNTLTAYVDSILSVATVTQLNKVILLWKQETTVKGEWAWLYYKQIAENSVNSKLGLYDRCITNRLHSRQGEGYGYPDNSLEGIKATIKDGYRGIRIAVASTSDHVIYCTHSYELRNNKTLNLNYVTVASTGNVYDGDIQINNVTSDFINTLLYKGYPIPTLESVFAFLNRFDLNVTLEVKERMGSTDVTNMFNLCKYYGIDPVFSCDSYNVNDLLAVSDDIHLESILEPYSRNLADTRYSTLKDHCKSLRFGLVYGNTMPTQADVIEFHGEGVTFRTAGNQPTQVQFKDAIKWADVVEVRGDYQIWINRLVNETW